MEEGLAFPDGSYNVYPNEVIAAQMVAQGYSPRKRLEKQENGALQSISVTGQKDKNRIGNFFISIIDMSAPQGYADPIIWKSDEPIGVDQRSLTSEKLEVAQLLVQGQLEAGHIQESNSPWNTPIFVIKKNLINGGCYKI